MVFKRNVDHYGHTYNQRMRVILFLTGPQRELLKRMCDDEDVTLVEVTRLFPTNKIRKLRDVGFWITAKPENGSIVINDNNARISKMVEA